MAYWIAGQTAYAKHFMCDAEADVAKLPTTVTRGAPQEGVDDTNTYTVHAGSTAKVIDTGDEYILQSDIDTWVKQPMSGGGGGAATPATGVDTFNGRSGAVVPQPGDYTADMVGAATMERVNSAINAAITGAIEGGTTDLEAGVTALPSGTLYVVYE